MVLLTPAAAWSLPVTFDFSLLASANYFSMATWLWLKSVQRLQNRCATDVRFTRHTQRTLPLARGAALAPVIRFVSGRGIFCAPIVVIIRRVVRQLGGAVGTGGL